MIIEAKNICVKLGQKDIFKNLNLVLDDGDILGIIGPSGSGKSVLMRTLLGLIKYQAGEIKFFGKEKNDEFCQKIGVLFQDGALFSSLNVLENVIFPMREYINLTNKKLIELAKIKLFMVGLKGDVFYKMPSELSGGMIKRVALARSLALDPDIIFLDEPTSGLDPISTSEFDELIKQLNTTMGISFFMITHDVSSLYRTCNKVAVLGENKIIMNGPISELKACSERFAWIKNYLNKSSVGE